MEHSRATSNPSLALRPASITPAPQHPHSGHNAPPGSSIEHQGATERARRGRGRGPKAGALRGGRGGQGHYLTPDNTNSLSGTGQALHESSRPGRGDASGPRSSRVTTTGRPFGGHLTSSHNEDSQGNGASQLNASAPVFVPGQGQPAPVAIQESDGRNGHTVQYSDRTSQRRPKKPAAKSTAPDIATRTHEDIANGIYECAICTSEVTRKSKVWSCKTCWMVFHLSCVKTWSKNESSAATQRAGADGDIPPPRQWRCPGCNLPKEVIPSSYYCWCEKESDPRSISGLPPHSCGQSCGRSRQVPKACPHPCDRTCHAGPCLPCTHKGPTQTCFCGKKSSTRRCIDTVYDTGWSCGEICGDLLPCGEHTCLLPCHEGLCGSCEVQLPSKCYCGKIEQLMACSTRGKELPSIQMMDAEQGLVEKRWIGSFDCRSACGRYFDCGKHSCSMGCHPQSLDPTHCPFSPDVIQHCPCGKTPLLAMSDSIRTTCSVPIPNCSKICSKPLGCGHLCQQTCHTGSCMPCLTTISIACRCGRVRVSSICHQGTEEPPQCLRTCKATMNCGRHECGERCCSGERKAAERQATKRKLRPLGHHIALDGGIEAEHICTRVCGRSLKCGNHTCQELCHKGPCGSCREAVFDDIICHCGRTILQAPSPCGTPPPACRFPCDRPSDCDHPTVSHNCHGDGEGCPKCPFLVEKSCVCGKKTLKNQPCWLSVPRCGETCGRKLRCGSHTCRNTCHRLGDCEDASIPCRQSCGKAKRVCGHPCEASCHAPSACREDMPCQMKMLVTCDCQNLKQEMKCNASKTNEGNTNKTLPCDDECTRLARNQKLALALNIDPESRKDQHVPYSSDTLKLFRENVKWSQTQERELRVFVTEENEKRLRFKPMPSHQRTFLHLLAEDFGLDSESLDPEPHRHVCIFKTPRFVFAPRKTLAECIRIKAEAEALSNTEQQEKLTADNIPFNGFLLSGPRFGTLLEDVRHEVQPILGNASVLKFDIAYLPSEEIALRARPASASTSMAAPALATKLKSLKPAIVSIVASKSLATSAGLCTLDESLNILRKEQDTAASDGWSKVAAKGSSTPRTAPPQAAIGSKSVYTVLGSKLREAKKKREEDDRRAQDEIVDDWEIAAQRDEHSMKNEATPLDAENGSLQ